MYPPRPKSKINNLELAKYEKTKEWLVQRKFNGDRIVIHVKNEKVQFWNRHQKLLAVSANISKQILSLNLDKKLEYWLDGEYLWKNGNNKIILFDVLQAGRYLFGVSQIDRLQILDNLVKSQKFDKHTPYAIQISENIYRAENFLRDFSARYLDYLNLDEIEGLVLRKINSKLDNYGANEYTVPWIIRCRKPTRNYSF